MWSVLHVVVFLHQLYKELIHREDGSIYDEGSGQGGGHSAEKDTPALLPGCCLCAVPPAWTQHASPSASELPEQAACSAKSEDPTVIL